VSRVLTDLKGRALSLSGKALGKLLDDPERAQRVAAAVGAVQRGKRRVGQAQGEALNAMGFASAADYQALRKRISSARRKAQALLERLERLS